MRCPLAPAQRVDVADYLTGQISSILRIMRTHSVAREMAEVDTSKIENLGDTFQQAHDGSVQGPPMI